MEVCYKKPEPGGQLYDYDSRADGKSLMGKSIVTTMSTRTGATANDVDLLQDVE